MGNHTFRMFEILVNGTPRTYRDQDAPINAGRVLARRMCDIVIHILLPKDPLQVVRRNISPILT